MAEPVLDAYLSLGETETQFDITKVLRGELPRWIAPSILMQLWDCTVKQGDVYLFPRIARQQFSWCTRPNGVAFRIADMQNIAKGAIVCIAVAIEDPHEVSVVDKFDIFQIANGAHVIWDKRISQAFLYTELMYADQEARTRGLFDGKQRKALPAGQRHVAVVEDDLLELLLSQAAIPELVV